MTQRPRYSINLTMADDDPREWGRRREAQGWDCLAITDHLVTDYRPPFPHLWVAAAAVATATSRVTVQTAFVNGVVRHPVDTAQAARQMQQISDGRFELGVGAGWYEPEVTAIGARWPSPRERADAFGEAVRVLRPLLAGEACSFRGRHYEVDVPPVGPTAMVPPPLIASVGGPRTTRLVTPHVDRVEIKPAAPATRGGSLDWDAYASVTDADVSTLIGRVRDVRPDVPVDVFVLCNAAADDVSRDLAGRLGDGFGGRFFGSPEAVAAAVERLGELGVDRVQLSPVDPAGLDRLAPLLYR